MTSMNHWMPISSAHMSAEAVSTPGMHVQPLVPSRSTVIVPSAPISTTFAPSRIAGGPDFSARAMRYSVMTSDMKGPFAGGVWLYAVYFAAVVYCAKHDWVAGPLPFVSSRDLQLDQRRCSFFRGVLCSASIALS